MEYWTALLLAQIIPILLYFYYKHSQKYHFWTKLGVKGPKPQPFVGSILQVNSLGQVKAEIEWQKQYGKVYGIYAMSEPVLTINDAELIKQVLVKDFHVFVNRDKQPFEHEIWSSNLFNSEDEQWKRIRAITSPSFTTGKLKHMQAMMNQCVDNLSNFFEKAIQNENGKINIKEVITRFTVDVIASTSFATSTNVYDQTGHNPFLENATKLFDFKIWRFILLFFLPDAFNRFIGNSIGLSDKRFNFFRDLSRAIIKQRKEDGGRTKRTDIVQLLMDSYVDEASLKETNYDKLTANAENDEHEESEQKVSSGSTTTIKKQLTENEIIAQCILFFAAGFETTATTLANALYNLAVNTHVQNRLVEELNTALDGVKENTSEYYDIVNNKIPYLEAVIKETLRLCPPLIRLQRRVGIDGYKLNGIPLPKDTEVNIGALAVHMNPEYYPEPELFNPDRFLPEFKHLLVPYTYLPFGQGPRNCIGMRFAYQEIRLCLAKILRQFTFSKTPETKVPMVYDNIGIMTCKNIPLKVGKR